MIEIYQRELACKTKPLKIKKMHVVWLKEEKKRWLARLKSGKCELEQVPVFLREDKEIVLIAVARAGLSLVHASKALKADKQVVPSSRFTIW